MRTKTASSKGKNISNGWKVNTVSLLKEILNNNPGMGTMSQPIQIFANILYEVATRANELQDPKLTALMCRLCLFEESDPYSPNYDGALTNKVINNAYPELKEVFGA